MADTVSAHEPEPSQLAIADEAVYIRLFRVLPGEDEAAAEALRRRFGNKAVICKVFGTADFAIVESAASWEDQPPLRELSDDFHAFDEIPLRCFYWRGQFSWESFYAADGLIAFSFVKIREDFLERRGILAEHDVIADLRTLAAEHPDVEISVLGTMGWHELLVIVTGYDLQKIESYILDLRSGFGKEDRPVPGVDSTTTVVSVRYPVVTAATFGGARALLHVSCSPDADQAVYDDLERRFGQGTVWCFGINDFFVSAESIEGISAYIDKLWGFRGSDKFRGSIYRTVTLLGGRPPTPPESRSAEGRDSPGIPFPALTREELDWLWREDSALAVATLDAFAALVDYSRDPRTWQAFRDLWPYAQKLRDALARPQEPSGTRPADPSFPSDNLEILSYGMYQRAVGTKVFWEAETASFPHPIRFAGIHRVLTAIAAVPDSILALSGKEWKGFILAGFTTDYRSFMWGAINVPWEALGNTAGWLAIAHEAAHEYLAQIDILGRFDIGIALQMAGLLTDRERLLFLELFCEIYGCRFVRGSQGWEIYSRRSWEYISRQPAVRNPERLRSIYQRFLLADLYFAMKSGIDVGSSGFIVKTAEFRKDEMLSEGGRNLAALDWRREIRVGSELAARVVSSRLLERLDRCLPKYDSANRPVDDLAGRLREGVVIVNRKVSETEVNPLTVLRAVLDQTHTEQWLQRVAALLTLWHHGKAKPS